MGMRHNKIAVIIPVFNVEEYVAECLESAICQTQKEIEIICVNDGSTVMREFLQLEIRV